MPRFRAPVRTLPATKAFPQGAPLLPGRRRCLALALVLGPLLGGCANNPIARQLAASFDTPAPTPATPPGLAGARPGTTPAAGIGAATPLVPPAGNAATASPSPSPGNAAAKPDKKTSLTSGATAVPGAVPGAKPGAKGNVQAATPGSANAQAPAQPRATKPAPYRVTIKLPGADPSAPAELVTRALRAAGVSFEVETIERIGAGSDANTGGRPAALRSTPAPAVR